MHFVRLQQHHLRWHHKHQQLSQQHHSHDQLPRLQQQQVALLLQLLL